MMQSEQTLLFPDDVAKPNGARDNSTTFVDNMRLPVHRWFRFSAGFSATWAESLVKDALAHQGPTRVFDSFAGSGTTLLAAENTGAESIGIEAQPFLCRIARAKLLRRSDPSVYASLIRRIRQNAAHRTPKIDDYPHLIRKCYSPEALQKLDVLRQDSPSRVCFVIGDSAPYGVYVPVMEWMGRLAAAAGFRNHEFEKTRDRNVKWKNRKHRVPLCEGRLWVNG